MMNKLENAQNMAMKEKVESDMKKEIKKLQRYRDTFKVQINNPEFKDKAKLIEARRRIESVSYCHSKALFTEN